MMRIINQGNNVVWRGVCSLSSYCYSRAYLADDAPAFKWDYDGRGAGDYELIMYVENCGPNEYKLGQRCFAEWNRTSTPAVYQRFIVASTREATGQGTTSRDFGDFFRKDLSTNYLRPISPWQHDPGISVIA